MIGREAYHNPYLLVEADARYYGDHHAQPSRAEIIEALMPFVEQEVKDGVPLKIITRHILGLFQGMRGARYWRRQLSDHVQLKPNDPQLIVQTLQQMLAQQDAE